MAHSEKLIPSYGRRRGRRLRVTKQSLMQELLPKLQVNVKNLPATELWLEIGFGGGEHLAAQAATNPKVCLIGCEPYVDGVASLLAHVDRNELKNVRIFSGDARELLEQLPAHSLSRVFVLFPDPWPKARHHKRRLIRQPFLEQLARVMKPGAALRLATDHADYCTWMLEQMLKTPHFEWRALRAADWQLPPADWVRTRYQEKAEKEGRSAIYLEFNKK